jgi:hypothetical protein
VDIYNAVGSTQVVVDLVGYYQNTTDDARLGNVAHYISGAVDPTTEGVIGDIYLNTATDTLFGPKTAAGWGTGASLAPAGQAGVATTAVGAVPSANTWATVPGATVSLPPGKWFVQAKGLGWSPSTSLDMNSRLHNLVANTDLDYTHLLGSEVGATTPFALGGMVTLTATTQIAVQVYSVNVPANAEQVKIFATQVSSINGA